MVFSLIQDPETWQNQVKCLTQQYKILSYPVQVDHFRAGFHLLGYFFQHSMCDRNHQFEMDRLRSELISVVVVHSLQSLRVFTVAFISLLSSGDRRTDSVGFVQVNTDSIVTLMEAIISVKLLNHNEITGSLQTSKQEFEPKIYFKFDENISDWEKNHPYPGMEYHKMQILFHGYFRSISIYLKVGHFRQLLLTVNRNIMLVQVITGILKTLVLEIIPKLIKFLNVTLEIDLL